MHLCMASTFELFQMRFCKLCSNLIRLTSQVIFIIICDIRVWNCQRGNLSTTHPIWYATCDPPRMWTETKISNSTNLSIILPKSLHTIQTNLPLFSRSFTIQNLLSSSLHYQVTNLAFKTSISLMWIKLTACNGWATLKILSPKNKWNRENEN